jgi:hypothetical protein
VICGNIEILASFYHQPSLHPSGQQVGEIFWHSHVFCCRIHPIPCWINSSIFSLVAANASSSSSVHSNGVFGLSKCPYHDLTSKMLHGVVKSLIAAVYLAGVLIPPNSTSLLANLNFSELNTRPFVLQWERMLNILWKATSTVSDHVMMSSTIFLKSLT